MKFVDYQVLLLFVCGAGLSSFFPLRRKTTSTHLKFALLSSTCRAYSSAPVIESNRKENIILIFRVCYYLKWRNSGFHLGERKRKKNILMKLRITKRMRMTWVKFLYFFDQDDLKNRSTSEIWHLSFHMLMVSRVSIPRPGWTVASAFKYDKVIYKRSILLWKIYSASEQFYSRFWFLIQIKFRDKDSFEIPN